ncbi:hypothetical protein [Corynebacterium pseudodiphtheriticum]|uniref:hypothetical protein n=1 Tax=Corynebacterium pseudodiphtheriticum TaxID=37637 RepID=UPI0020BECE66|nr:hypothetical protein [Corynebacterium pseudodiphtheriticum]UQV54186.1 hypothetical protein L2D23_00155 [Corynebacterium pseudodiphtheriticum]
MGSANVNLRIARNLSSTGWEKFKDYRDKKSQEAFDFLESAAKTVDKSAEKHFPEARKEAGKLTKAAHARLDKSLESLQGTGRELADGNVSETVENVREAASENFSKATKKAQKQAKKLRKKANKKLGRKNRKRLSRVEKKANAAAQKVKDKAAKKLDKKTKSQSRGFGFYALWAAVLAAVVGVIAYVLNKRNSGVQEQPPKASDYSSNTTSTLVYSSTSEDDLEAPNADASEENKKAEKKAGELAEDPAERDEELLADIDEQLAKNLSQGATENLAASEATRAVAHDDTDAAEKAAQIDEQLKDKLDSESGPESGDK